MRTSHIKNAKHGFVELFFCLIVFAILIWGVGHINIRLIHRGRLEQAIWIYGISRIHHSTEEVSKELAKYSFPTPTKSALKDNPTLDEGSNLLWDSHKDCYHELLQALIFKEDLPLTFRLHLPTRACGKSEELRGSERKAPILDHINKYVTAVAPLQIGAVYFEDSTSKKVAPVSMYIPGDDYRNKGEELCIMCVQRWMWQEASVKEFGLIPIEGIAIKEILEHSGGSLPLEFLSGNITTLAADYASGKLKDLLSSQMKNEFGIDFSNLDETIKEVLYEQANKMGGKQFNKALDQYRNQISGLEGL